MAAYGLPFHSDAAAASGYFDSLVRGQLDEIARNLLLARRPLKEPDAERWGLRCLVVFMGLILGWEASEKVRRAYGPAGGGRGVAGRVRVRLMTFLVVVFSNWDRIRKKREVQYEQRIQLGTSLRQMKKYRKNFLEKLN